MSEVIDLARGAALLAAGLYLATLDRQEGGKTWRGPLASVGFGLMGVAVAMLLR